jgi:cytidylate kinase
MVISIDGPAGAGKSTVARAVADKLGFSYLDTGAMYRAAALASVRTGHSDQAAVRGADIWVGERVFLDGEDVTDLLRTPEVSEKASTLATQAAVRSALVEKQRELLRAGDWVAEGRDIGTVVAPDAALKIFLTATAQERARRRARELGADVDVILSEQLLRDEQDRNRADSPLRPADDAVELDCTDRTVCEVVGEIIGLLHAPKGS